MKRVWIVSVWLVGMTVPTLLAAMFLFGCCVLPFHHALHHVLPLCRVAAGILHGDHGDADHQHQPSTPAPEKERVTAPPLITTLTAKESIRRSSGDVSRIAVLASAVGYRNFISLGAVRCDQDVGMQQLLTETFRI